MCAETLYQPMNAYRQFKYQNSIEWPKAERFESHHFRCRDALNRLEALEKRIDDQRTVQSSDCDFTFAPEWCERTVCAQVFRAHEREYFRAWQQVFQDCATLVEDPPAQDPAAPRSS